MSNANLQAPPHNYLQIYSLKCEPFANTLDGRFFYAGTALMQRLDLLIHLTQFGDSVVLVSGPDGSGKTTLLSRLTAQATRQWRLCPINADEFEQFPRLMADTLRADDAQDELEMLNHWASETDNSQLLIILVDKAEALSGPAVDLLCKLLACPVRERLRLVLFGTPEAQQALKNTLDSRNLPGSRQLLEVPRLSEEETSSYLMYRLAVAGYSGESPFTATEVRGICKAAEGRPGAINMLARETLVEHQARKRSKRVSAATGKPKFGAAAWGPMTLVIVTLATYLGWQRLQPTPDPAAPPAEPAVEAQSIPLAIPEPVAVPEPQPEPVTPPTLTSTTASNTTTVPPNQTVPETAAQVEPEDVTLPIPAAVDTAGDTGKKIQVEVTAAVVAEAPTSPQPESVEPPTAPATITTPESQAKPSTTAGVVVTEAPASPQPDSVEPPAAPATINASDSPAKTPTKAVTVAADKAAAEFSEPAARPDEKKPAITPAPEADKQGPHREAWLLAQQGELYSLQLLGSRSQKSVVDYMNRYHLDISQSAYYRGDYRGGEWYVLMYGLYPDRQAALDARTGLPAAVRKAKPWPRNLASVHKSIKAAKQ